MQLLWSLVGNRIRVSEHNRDDKMWTAWKSRENKQVSLSERTQNSSLPVQESKFGTQSSPAYWSTVALEVRKHEERRKPAYWVSSFPKFLLQSHLRRPLLKKTILGTSFSFSEQSAVVETKELFTSMAWRFNVSRATTVALALFLCLGLIQFSMAQNEVEVSIGRTISTNNNDLHSRKRTDST